MKKIQFKHLMPLVVLLIALMAACSSSPNSDIIGMWGAEDVQSDSDTNQIRPEVLTQALDFYRANSFEFLESDSMNLISDGSVHPGEWEYREDEAAIYMKIDGSRAPELMKFAEYQEGKLIATNETGIGTIVVTYVKQQP